LAIPRLFGTNGIRGVVGGEIDSRFAYRVGSSVGVLFAGGTVAVGRDGRISSPMLTEGLVAGILAQGANVEDLGLVTTSALEFLVKQLGCSGGVMVTASHNPPEYNGFKVVDKDGIELPRGREMRVERLMHNDSWKLKSNPGERTLPQGVLNDYFDSAIGHLDKVATGVKGLKVVVDPGNGVSVLTTPVVLKRLGCEVLTINDNIDGKFPGRLSEPRPETLSVLSSIVKEERADLGIAHDGDGDRALFSDETGTVHWGDRSLALIEDELLRDIPGAKIVTPLNSSMAVREIAKKRHGTVVLTKVGSIEVSRTMVKTAALLGGEENGGIFYGPHHPVRDGTMAALLVIKAMARNRLSLSELFERLPRFPMAKEKFQVRNQTAKLRVMKKLSFSLKQRVTSRLDGLKVDVKNRGWVLIRPSGTEPLIRFYAEGFTEKDLSLLVGEFKPLLVSAVELLGELN
jgi:phosphomannomutase / phosphoglucomutase